MADTNDYLDDEPGMGFGPNADLPISALASDQVIGAPASTSLQECAAVMDREGIGLLVLRDDDGGLAGLLSERDVLRSVATGVDLGTPAIEVGHGRDIQRALASSTVNDVAREMMSNYVRHVLVTEPDGSIGGVVSIRDLLVMLAD